MFAAGGGAVEGMPGACAKELPAGSEYTRPEGGMNLWVRLPEPLDASELAVRAERENVSYLPGRYFRFRVRRIMPCDCVSRARRRKRSSKGCGIRIDISGPSSNVRRRAHRENPRRQWSKRERSTGMFLI